MTLLNYVESYLKNALREALKPLPRTHHPPVNIPSKQHPDADALEEFVFNIHSAAEMTGMQSRRNIEASVIEILQYGQHTSNGILITSNGYFITAKHCLDKKNLDTYAIRTSQGRLSDVKKICVISEMDDIMLAKAYIPDPARAMQYKVLSDHTIKNAIRVASLSRWNGKLRLKKGHVLETKFDTETINKKYYREQFSSTIPSQPGDSGSPIISSDGSFSGITSCGGINEVYTSAARSYKALELISVYAKRLRK